MYIIWSYRHSQYWRDKRAGYTSDAFKAGVYSAPMAGDIVISSGLPGNNVAIDVALIPQIAELSVSELENKLNEWRRC